MSDPQPDFQQVNIKSQDENTTSAPPQKISSFEDALSQNVSHRLKFSDLLRLSLRTFRVRPTRTMLTILGISVGIGTVFFLISLGYGLQYILVGRLASTEDSLVTLEAFYPTEGGLVIKDNDIQKIQAMDLVKEVSPVAEFPGEVNYQNLSGSLIVKIIDPNYFRLSGVKADYGDIFKESEKTTILSNTALKLLNWNEDGTSLYRQLKFKIFYQDETGKELKNFEVPYALNMRGIVLDEFQPPYAYISSEHITEKPPFYQRIFVKAKDLDSVEPLRDELISKGYLISARIDLVNQAKKITTIITIVLSVFGVTALVVSAIGMFNTMLISFLERIFEVGIMKSIGATTGDIRNLFLMESLVIGLLGGLGGLTIGFTSAELFNLGLNILARYLGGKPVTLFVYPIRFVILVIILSGFVGALSGFWPARRAAKLSAREAFLRK